MKYEGSVDDLRKDNALVNRGQYTYVGSFSNKLLSPVTLFVFHCSICAKDEELFGNALFWTRKADYVRGQTFCGCGKKVIWTLEQATIKSERAAKEAGSVFKGIILPYKGGESRCNLYCNTCQHSWTSKLSNLWALKRGCPSCRNLKFTKAGTEAAIRADEDVIRDFMNSGFYHVNTKFVKTNRKAKNNGNNYWKLYCPLCDSTFEAQQGHILKGNVRCDCSPLNCKETYIIFLKDGEDIVGLKFGISKDSYKRLITHQYHTRYETEMFAIFKYKDSYSCKSAERECINSLVCGIIDKELFNPGWTETTYTYNLDRIISIFKQYGGVRIF